MTMGKFSCSQRSFSPVFTLLAVRCLLRAMQVPDEFAGMESLQARCGRIAGYLQMCSIDIQRVGSLRRRRSLYVGKTGRLQELAEMSRGISLLASAIRQLLELLDVMTGGRMESSDGPAAEAQEREQA